LGGVFWVKFFFVFFFSFSRSLFFFFFFSRKKKSTTLQVLAELCARECDFPKMWNRPQQIKLQDFTGNGIFTSSTTSDDWVVRD